MTTADPEAAVESATRETTVVTNTVILDIDAVRTGTHQMATSYQTFQQPLAGGQHDQLAGQDI